MEAWIEFGRGTLFRLSFSLMALGLLRVLVLTIFEITAAYRRSPDRVVAWREIARQTLGWLVPLGRLGRSRPLYSVLSFAFHVGLLLVPLFLASHILLWRQSLGIGWPALPQRLANSLTLLTIAAALGLFFGRVLSPAARALSRRQDYLWPLLLAVPFATGYICSQAAIGPKAYQSLMLVHVYSGDLILLLVPFTKIAHCVLAPLSQVATAIAWKFVPGAGDRVAATLGFEGQPTWVERARLGGEVGAPAGRFTEAR